MARFEGLSFADVLRDFRRVWTQLALTDVLARALGVAVLTPAVALLLKLFLLAADDRVLTDTDIASFLLHPVGLLAGFVVGAVSLAILFVEYGALMTIAFGATTGRRVTWLAAIRYVLAHRAQLAALAARLLGRVALVCAPFLAALGAVYWIFLRAHDINFYLTDRPPELRHALAVAGVLCALAALALLRLLAGWILALPLVLFDDRPGWRAMGTSAETMRGRSGSIAALLAAWIGGGLALRWLAAAVIGGFGNLLVPDFGGSLTWFAVGLGLTLGLSGCVNLALSFALTALPSLLVTRMFVRFAGPGAFRPAIADAGALDTPVTSRIPGKWLLAAAAGAALLLIGTGFELARSLDARDSVEIIAHRGASGAAPENTIAAFERAIDLGADWIELDVQEDAEGAVIVAHDSDFMKIGGDPMKVWESTAANRRDLDIGSWFDPEFSDQRVARLRDVLELARGRIGVVIELKYYGHDEMLEARVVEEVEDAGMVGQIELMSLKLPGLQKAGALRPDWRRGLLNTVSVGDLTRLDVSFLALNAAAARTPIIRKAHQRGMQVYAWTIDDPVQMSVMLSRGVDGIITDEPALVREVVEWRDRLGPFGRLVVWIAGESGLLRGAGESSPEGDA
jgi:glycerophosphoryl diester phosphodiesterase